MRNPVLPLGRNCDGTPWQSALAMVAMLALYHCADRVHPSPLRRVYAIPADAFELDGTGADYEDQDTEAVPLEQAP